MIKVAWGRSGPYGRALLRDMGLFTFPFPPFCGTGIVLGPTRSTFFVFNPVNIDIVIEHLVFARGLGAFVWEGTHEAVERALMKRWRHVE